MIINNEKTLFFNSEDDEDIDIIELAEELKTNKTLTKLTISFVNSFKHSDALADALRVNTTLKELYIFLYERGQETTRALYEALLGINKTLEVLSFSHERRNVEVINSIAEFLSTNKTLKTLKLPFNKIDDVGTKALTDALYTNRTLKTLNLSRNRISDVGAKYLTDALSINTNLKVLDLSLNEITDEGASVIAEFLSTNRTLKALNLIRNKITDVGAILIASALHTNKTLEKLIIYTQRDNYTPYELVEAKIALEEAMEVRNRSVRGFVKSRNPSYEMKGQDNPNRSNRFGRLFSPYLGDGIGIRELLGGDNRSFNAVSSVFMPYYDVPELDVSFKPFDINDPEELDVSFRTKRTLKNPLNHLENHENHLKNQENPLKRGSNIIFSKKLY